MWAKVFKEKCISFAIKYVKIFKTALVDLPEGIKSQIEQDIKLLVAGIYG